MIGKVRKYIVRNFSFIPRIYMKIKKLQRKWSVTKEAYKSLISSDKNELVVVVGVNRFSNWFVKKIQKKGIRYWGRTTFEPEIVDKDIELKSIDDLLFEDPDEIRIYVFEERKDIKAIGDLQDMGIPNNSIVSVGISENHGSRLYDGYDAQLGLCNISKYQGFEIFENSENGDSDANVFTIVTLGGSTTDPYMANIISWSEYLFHYLSDLGIKVRVICGGIASYMCVQELNKLIRDVIDIQPNLVISYSGVNDLRSKSHKEDREHLFTLNYQQRMLEKAVKRRLIANELQCTFENITKLTYGPKSNKAKWEHWIDCERKMFAVCREYNIEYMGCLQPYRDAFTSDYENAQKYIRENKLPWLIDMTAIFDGKTDVYFDDCHVYEKGNRIIAKKMMTYILPMVQRRNVR